MKAKEQNIVEKLKLAAALASTDVPFEVWRCFGSAQKEVCIMGNQIGLGEDFVSLSEAQTALQWYVEQLGGAVKWQK